jgi:predicted transcriptional regulator of viral defense system
MNARDALGRLRRLRVPAVTTADAAAVLGVSIEAASHALRRLASSGLVTAVRKALWALDADPDPLALGEYVTAPYPSYVSLQTALYRHGMVTQIPSMIYLVSLGRGARIETRLGTYSIHHVPPELFGGFEAAPKLGLKLARPEKALVDVLYLSPTRGRLFAALPELELPRGFRPSIARRWARRIPSRRLRTMVEQKLRNLLAPAVV